MLISEISVYEFLKDKINLSDADAKRYAKELAATEEKLHHEIKNGVSKEIEIKQVATKMDIQILETKIEKGFKETIIWVVGFMIAIASISLAIIKLF